MVTDAILNFFRFIADGAYSLLPQWTVTVDSSAVLAARNAFLGLNLFAPVSEVGVLCSLCSVTFAGVMAFKWLKQIISWIRGSG